MKLYDKVEQQGSKKQQSDFNDIISPALDRFKEIQDFEQETRKNMLIDRAFDDGKQWDQSDIDSRNAEKRPWLTIPRTNQFSDRLKNEQRQNKPGIKISPVDDGADEKAAQNRQGLIRHIQYTSRAQIARQWAFNCAVTEGRGHWVVRTEYAHDASFDQNVIVDIIKEPLNVYMDWRHQKPDYSDCKYGFIIKRMPRKEFEDEYPKAQAADWYSVYDDTDWISSDDIMVAEYYCRKDVERELLELERTDKNGNTERIKVYRDQLEKDEEIKPEEILRKRTVTEHKWHWYKMTSVEVLDSRELPGIKEIPIMTTVGKETVINGTLNIKGIIRDLIDPQKMYNFWSSQETEWINMAPKAPFIGAEGQFEGYEDDYRDANVINHAFLPYKPVSHAGQLVPPPQRQQSPSIPIGIVQAKQEIIEDMKAISGIYDASLGQRSNETSGVAIRQREIQGDTANYHFVDNYKNALEHEGRIENNMLPIYYEDVNRRIKIMGEDDEVSMLDIGEMEKGEMVTLGDGEFDVIVEVGPSFTTARQEAAANMLELAGKVPVVAEGAGDLAIKMLDSPMKDEMAERAKRLTEMKYPGLTAPMEENEEDSEIAMLTQQLQQTGQQLEQMAQEREQMMQQIQMLDQTKIQNESQKNQVEAQKLELESMKIKSDEAIKKAEIEMRAMIADLENETKLKIEEMKLTGDVVKIDRTAQHQAANTPKIEEKPEKETVEPSVVNVSVDANKDKEAIITKQKDGSYKVVQKGVSG